MTWADLTQWLTENGFTPAEFAELTQAPPGTLERWKTLDGHLPYWLLPFLTVTGKDLTRRGRPLCRCGCGTQTLRSYLTGHYNLFLPQHYERPLHLRQTRQHPKLPLLKECPECQGPLDLGTFAFPQRLLAKSATAIAGQQCPRCRYRYYLELPPTPDPPHLVFTGTPPNTPEADHSRTPHNTRCMSAQPHQSSLSNTDTRPRQ